MIEKRKFTAAFAVVSAGLMIAAGSISQAADKESCVVKIASAKEEYKKEYIEDKEEYIEALAGGKALYEVPKMVGEDTKTTVLQAKTQYEAQVKKEAEERAAAEKAAEKAAAEKAAAEAAQREEEKRLLAEYKASQTAMEAETVETVQNSSVQASASEQELLAALIFCEAGNQPYEGQVAVGAVVMNRVKNSAYPNSISEVIYQSGQFTPAMTGWLDAVLADKGYTESAMQAAADALAGNSPVGDLLYFDCGGYGYQLGDHFFH